MDEASDEALMARVASGSEAAFRRLSDRHLARILAIAGRITRNPADSEEVAQETLLRVWVHAPRWRPEAAFRTWLYRIVVNLCLDRSRRPAFASLDDVAEPVDPAPDPERRTEDAAMSRVVNTAISELSERQRAAVTLTYFEGLSDAEAAEVLDTTVGGVESLLVRARRTLRERLGRHFPMRDAR